MGATHPRYPAPPTDQEMAILSVCAAKHGVSIEAILAVNAAWDAAKDAVVELAKRGASQDRIRDLTGMGYDTVRNWIHKAGQA